MSFATQPDMENHWQHLQHSAAFASFAKALRYADTAGPKDIPKADGLLKYAEQVLQAEVAGLGLGEQATAAIMHMLKLRAQKQ